MLTEKELKKVLSLPCVVLEKQKIIFFRVPKNASTSIHRGYLQRNYTTLNKRTSSRAFTKWKENVTKDWFEQAFKFTFVRNPWDRFVSLFVYFTTYESQKPENSLIKRWNGDIPSFRRFTLDFENICSNRVDIKSHAMKQIDFVLCNGKKFVDFVGHFEFLVLEFNSVIRALELKREPLKHMMKTEHPPYMNFYDAETRQKVYELYKEDVEYFQYDFIGFK